MEDNINFEIYHHGIKGQKWGIRRFQNEDGSLTESGRKRYITKESIKNAGRTAQKYSGKIMEGMDGRELFSNREKRIARGKELKSERRTMVGAYGRFVGRSIVAGAAGAAAIGLCSATGLRVGADATRAALSVIGAMSAIRLVQDVRDIGAYNKDVRKRKAGG